MESLDCRISLWLHILGAVPSVGFGANQRVDTSSSHLPKSTSVLTHSLVGVGFVGRKEEFVAHSLIDGWMGSISACD